jgi:hypothetical protein
VHFKKYCGRNKGTNSPFDLYDWAASACSPRRWDEVEMTTGERAPLMVPGAEDLVIVLNMALKKRCGSWFVARQTGNREYLIVGFRQVDIVMPLAAAFHLWGRLCAGSRAVKPETIFAMIAYASMSTQHE